MGIGQRPEDMRRGGKTLYYQGFIEDLTSRMAAEEARRKAEQKFREIFEDAPEGIFQVTPDGKTLALNPASADMLGYESAAEAIASIQDAAQDAWVDPQERARFAALLDQQGTVRDFQCQLKRKDGRPIRVSTTAKKICGPDGKTIYYQGFNQDITEQKRLEAALRANTRELQLLSEINNVLVRARTEKELLRNCCRIMVEIGGYRMAWVGFADEGPGKPIVTVAHYGSDEGFLDSINLTWAETEHEDGPVSRSLRTGEIQIAEDICADPLVHSWRTEALKHGYRMVIALPFSLTDGARASLAVFGESPNIRSGSERGLMEQIASDLAYGIATLRTEISKTVHQETLRAALEQTINVIAETVEQRDPYTAGHQRRVADLCMRIAQKLGLPEDRTHGLHLAASIHDLGKIGIPAEILSKPGLLTPTQFNLLKEHAQLGYEILKDVAFPWPIADMIMQHHERLDGSGYPLGLKGDAISLEARILAVADVAEAMSSHRPYRAAQGVDVALDEILAQRGTLYDSEVTVACVRVFREDGYEFPGAGPRA
jgi:PAS domain S-box-containing protein